MPSSVCFGSLTGMQTVAVALCPIAGGHGILPSWGVSVPGGSRRAGFFASAKMYCSGFCIVCGLAEPEL